MVMNMYSRAYMFVDFDILVVQLRNSTVLRDCPVRKRSNASL